MIGEQVIQHAIRAHGDCLRPNSVILGHHPIRHLIGAADVVRHDAIDNGLDQIAAVPPQCNGVGSPL